MAIAGTLTVPGRRWRRWRALWLVWGALASCSDAVSEPGTAVCWDERPELY